MEANIGVLVDTGIDFVIKDLNSGKVYDLPKQNYFTPRINKRVFYYTNNEDKVTRVVPVRTIL